MTASTRPTGIAKSRNTTRTCFKYIFARSLRGRGLDPAAVDQWAGDQADSAVAKWGDTGNTGQQTVQQTVGGVASVPQANAATTRERARQRLQHESALHEDGFFTTPAAYCRVPHVEVAQALMLRAVVIAQEALYDAYTREAPELCFKLWDGPGSIDFSYDLAAYLITQEGGSYERVFPGSDQKSSNSVVHNMKDLRNAASHPGTQPKGHEFACTNYNVDKWLAYAQKLACALLDDVRAHAIRAIRDELLAPAADTLVELDTLVLSTSRNTCSKELLRTVEDYDDHSLYSRRFDISQYADGSVPDRETFLTPLSNKLLASAMAETARRNSRVSM